MNDYMNELYFPRERERERERDRDRQTDRQTEVERDTENRNIEAFFQLLK